MTVLEYILQETKSKSIADLKFKLKKAAKDEYGTRSAQIKCKSFRAFYTNNPNHFCKFGFSFNGVGMANTTAMDAESITIAGKKRGCEGCYIKPEFLNRPYKL